MRCGLYGKLPVKRDFIALRSPRPFLNVWEPWLQSAMSASRQSLATEWQSAFLTAPIWRFWLGADLCGTAILGAFMPSLDEIGRYFPLTVFVLAEEGETIAPPELDAQDAWYAAVEEFLLGTLDHGIEFEQVTAALERLAAPAAAPILAPPPGATMISTGFVAKVGERELPALFSSMRHADYVRSCASASYWWTVGGEGYDPMAIVSARMPDPFLFTEMLTGRFAFAFE